MRKVDEKRGERNMKTSQSPIRVVVAGAAGKLGREAVQALEADEQFQVVGLLVRSKGQPLASLGLPKVPMESEVAALLEVSKPDVWLDLTDANSVVHHVNQVVEHGVRPVVGATGYTLEDISRWDKTLFSQGNGGIACPNFAIGALLMMRFAEQAARFFPKAEIIELHHDGKKDKPSGTAKHTAEGMMEASGGDVPIHSIRLPGLVAHQEVLFGGTGELLTIRHDSMSRQSFIPGIMTACREVSSLQGMVYGLERLLW
jgi:4-hydroxy-tetrahydrodipicolinate reductase